jgi:hypothetical protein
MAILSPSFENINRLKVPPTDGELYLLKFLYENLDNKYEIYFQPYINGDFPDIVVMRENSGVLIIEVKDWDLNNYYIDERKNWRVRKNDTFPLKSPFKQVESYKNTLYGLHIEHLHKQKVTTVDRFSTVSCAVYFHHQKEDYIRSFVHNKHRDDIAYDRFIGKFELLGSDSLTKKKFSEMLRRRRLCRDYESFDGELYKNFKKYLKPSMHTIEQGIEIVYTEKQKALIESKSIQQKIRGFAGSGKTMILAKRAVNSHIRTGSKVLILTYNITLKNYIHDKINEVRETFNWKNFCILNYHDFINSQLNNLEIPILPPNNPNEVEGSSYRDRNYYSNESVFDDTHIDIEKYNSIFIDEVQDYKSAWLKIIRKYFLVQGGELVVYGDEKQNVYNIQMDSDRKPNTGISGRWNELDESYRLTTKVANLAIKYQNHFFASKYDIEKVQVIEQQTLFDAKISIEYYFLDSKLKRDQVFEKIISLIENSENHPNDICFLAHKKEFLRELDFLLRSRLRQNTETTFEKKEMFEERSRKINDQNRLKNENDRIEKSKKDNFWMNPGFSKLSTIHSFKGWEVPALFLIIDSSSESGAPSSEELIYTAITRCRLALYILNIGNTKYHEFFNENVQESHLVS